MKKNLFAKIILTILTILTAVFIVNAQSGSLDTTFGSSGMTVTNINGFSRVGGLYKTLIQSDGKILDLRDVHFDAPSGVTDILVRYNADGSIDYGFGSSGVVYMNWNSPSNAFGNAYDIALQSVEGIEKIIVAGTGYGGSSTLRVDRYNIDGTVDGSFGTNGSAFFNAAYALGVAVQPDGKIVTVGDTGYMVRLTSSGSLDTSFGNRGIAQTTGVTGWQLAIQSNGRILVGGGPNAGRNSITVARFNTNGSLDDGSRKDSTPGDSLGTSGKTSIDFFPNGYSGSYKRNFGLQVDGSGRILVSGEAWRSSSDTNKDYAVARLMASGKLDTTFDGDGKAIFDLSGTTDGARGLALQSDGKIVLSGLANTSTNNQKMALVRLNTDGSLDASFGTGGIQINDYSSENEGAYFAATQIDPNCTCEKIVVTGQIQLGGVYSAFAARYLE